MGNLQDVPPQIKDSEQRPSGSALSDQQERTIEPCSDVTTRNPAYADSTNAPKPISCEFCGALRHHHGINIGGRIMWIPSPEPCSCAEAVEAERQKEAAQKAADDERHLAEEARRISESIRRNIGASGIGERFLRRTFETFRPTSDTKKAYALTFQYASSFENMLPHRDKPLVEKNGLFIVGPTGTGKTHLAAAIANYLLAQGKPVICMTMIDLLARIKKTFSGRDIDESEVLHIYKTVPLLIIDDLGKETPSEWALSTIFNIVNARYEAALPIIVTSNYGETELVRRMMPRKSDDSTTAAATVDRLVETCVGVVLAGKNYRRQTVGR